MKENKVQKPKESSVEKQKHTGDPIEKNDSLVSQESLYCLPQNAENEKAAERSEHREKENPLATQPIGSLLRRFAIPSVIAMLVSAIYNIVDQIFIGQGVGILGNAATNVAFPVVTLTIAVSLLLGIGSASNFNLSMGRGEKHAASKFVGNAIVYMAVFGILLVLSVRLFLEDFLILFGTTEAVMPYAKTYLGITVFGLPFAIFITGGCNLVRADGSPKQSMMIILTGAIINTVLDPLFIFVFDWGIAGAAWATVIGQFISFLMVVSYLRNFRTVALSKESFIPEFFYFQNICKLGIASFFNQTAITVVQIVMNNTLRYYGAMSPYGSEIPLASAGIVIKINMMIFAISLGIAQGNQPIVGFNYGAKNYDRAKESIKMAIFYATAISTAGFVCFQLFPRQIIGVFGEGSEEYFYFASRYLRVFLFMTFINGIQPIVATFFTSIGKAGKGLMMSMTRQIVFLIPLILFLPTRLGIEGVLYAGPIADSAAAVLAITFLRAELKHFDEQLLLNEARA